MFCLIYPGLFAACNFMNGDCIEPRLFELVLMIHLDLPDVENKSARPANICA